MKNVKFRGIPRKKDEIRSNVAAKTQIPRLGSKFRGPRKLWALEITGGDYQERSRERQRDRAAQSNNIKFVIIMRYVNKFTFSYGLYACIYAVIMYYFRYRRAHMG